MKDEDGTDARFRLLEVPPEHTITLKKKEKPLGYKDKMKRWDDTKYSSTSSNSVHHFIYTAEPLLAEWAGILCLAPSVNTREAEAMTTNN